MRYHKGRRNKVYLNTGFDSSLLNELREQCESEGRYVNDLLSYLAVEYLKRVKLRNNVELDPYLADPDFIPMPAINPFNKEDWQRYADSIDDPNEASRIEGIFTLGKQMFNNRFYAIKRNKMIPSRNKVVAK